MPEGYIHTYKVKASVAVSKLGYTHFIFVEPGPYKSTGSILPRRVAGARTAGGDLQHCWDVIVFQQHSASMLVAEGNCAVTVRYPVH